MRPLEYARVPTQMLPLIDGHWLPPMSPRDTAMRIGWARATVQSLGPKTTHEAMLAMQIAIMEQLAIRAGTDALGPATATTRSRSLHDAMAAMRCVSDLARAYFHYGRRHGEGRFEADEVVAPRWALEALAAYPPWGTAEPVADSWKPTVAPDDATTAAYGPEDEARDGAEDGPGRSLTEASGMMTLRRDAPDLVREALPDDDMEALATVLAMTGQGALAARVRRAAGTMETETPGAETMGGR